MIVARSELDWSKATTELKKDLSEQRHCFCHHDHCSSDFCTAMKEKSVLHTGTGATEMHNDETDDDDDINGKLKLNEVTLQLYNLFNHSHLQNFPQT